MLKIIRKSSIIVIVAIAANFVAGCQEKEVLYQREKSAPTFDLETEMWIQSLFDSAYSNHAITTTVFSDGTRVTRYEPLISASPRLKSGVTEDGEEDPWIYWGTVENVFDANKMADDMKKTYGSSCYEMKSEPFYKKGKYAGRKMYHRVCQSN
jgi:hypothetical protein